MQASGNKEKQGTVIVIPPGGHPAVEDEQPCPPLGAEGEAQRAAMEKAEAKS